MVTRSARVRGRSAKSEVGVVCQENGGTCVRFARRAWRVRHVPVVSCVRERWDQLQCACVGVCLSRARGHRRIEMYIRYRSHKETSSIKSDGALLFDLFGPGAVR